MNGRCETDPLDAAINVCDRCFGEFCDEHLVHPKGRKHPICNKCALDASGVRGSTKLELRGSRRTAKSRRANLKTQTVADEAVFQYFDADAETADPDAAEPDSNTEQADSKEEAAEATPDDADEAQAAKNTAAGDEAQLKDQMPPTPAVAKLEEIRRGSEVDGPSLEPSVASAESTPTTETAPPPREPAPAKQQAEQPARQPAKQQAEQPARQPARQQAGDEATESTAAASVPHRNTAAAPAPRPTHRRPPDRRKKDLRPTAPMIGEIRNLDGRRADDIRQPPSAAQDPITPSPGASQAKTLNAIDEFDAARPQPEVDHKPGRSADIDADGNWIPPILRGIAADASEAKADLPKRRSND